MKINTIVVIIATSILGFGGFAILPDEVNATDIQMNRTFWRNAIDEEGETSPYCDFSFYNDGGDHWPDDDIVINVGDELDLTVKCKTYCLNDNEYGWPDKPMDERHWKTLFQVEIIFSSSKLDNDLRVTGCQLYNTDPPVRDEYKDLEYDFLDLEVGDWVSFFWEINIVAYDNYGNRLMSSDVTTPTYTIDIIST